MISTVEQRAVERFRDLVAERLGLHFENGKLDRLAEVLEGRLRRVHPPNLWSYFDRFEAPATAREELAALAAELTVGETYFLRHPDQFRAFTEVVLPERLSVQSERRRLRLLSAGCASGEEAYSLAIHLCDGMPDRAGWDVRVVGIDVNAAALQKAAEARYTAWSLRGVPEDVVRRYFRPDGKDYVLVDAARSLVSFAETNLAADEPAIWPPDEFDAIFCRNVTMYFTPHATQKAIARLTQSLAPGGYLFLGPAENLRGVSHYFHLRHTHDTFYYQRRSAAAQSASPAPTEPLPGKPTETWLSEIVTADASWVGAVCQSSNRIAQLSDRVAHPGAAPETVPATTGAVPDIPRSSGLNAVRELLGADRFEDALAVLQALPQEEWHNADAQLLAAIVLTNRGCVAEAEQLCRAVLAGDELNAEAHYLLALCCEHSNELATALEHDRMAIYLDAQFAMPHLHLGLLARKTGDRELACREFRQASVLLARADSSHILLFGGGFHREALILLCQAELRACGGTP